MNILNMITAVDSHTEGEPTRVVTGGVPFVPGKTMPEKKQWLAENRDDLRKSLMWEPRGHKDMLGALITPPVSKDADFGVIFMDGDGYLDMCGHGSVGVVTVVLETGMVPMKDSGEQTVVMDTPAGLITARAIMEHGKAKSVSFQNVPSFYYSSLTVKVPGLGEIPVDISYGGNYFALVNVNRLNMPLEVENIKDLTEIGLTIRDLVNQQAEIIHPGTGAKGSVDLTEIYDESSAPAVTKNIVIFGAGQVDRSPCGTGTCAKMAVLNKKNKLSPNEIYRHKSIIGTEFQGKILEETTVGDYKAIIPEITARAYITGIQQFVMDADDPFKYGFQL